MSRRIVCLCCFNPEYDLYDSLDRNYVFAKEEAGQLLGVTLASTSKLCELK